MDHDKLRMQTSSMSCGVAEVYNLSADASEDELLFAIATQLYHPARGNPVAFICMSDIDEVTKTEKLLTAVGKYGFGIVSNTVIMDNPKTSNMIKVYTWAIHHNNFRKWYFEYRINRLKKQADKHQS